MVGLVSAAAWAGAIQGLDAVLLIHRQDQGVVRRIKIEPQDGGLLGLKLRVWTFATPVFHFVGEGALALLGNRYGLPRTARQLLHRGVFALGEAAPRRARFSLDSWWAAAKLRQGFGAFVSLTAGGSRVPTIY